MYIIDRNRDYYDYLSNVYGVDKGIVFDRRGSIRLENNWFSAGFSIVLAKYSRDDSLYFILEVGTIQYLIKAYDPKWIESPFAQVSHYKIELVRKFQDQKHRYEAPISIRRVRLSHWWRWGKNPFENRQQYIQTERYEELILEPHYLAEAVNLPILAETKLTSFIDADEIWKEIMNYISSLNNDIDVSIPMTDVEKAEQHGFDKKTSFRHPIK